MLKLVLTCEHGGKQVPEEFSDLFASHQDALESHRGYDLGALDLYRSLEDLADIGFYSETTRLLVELNRSLHHKSLFSSITKPLPDRIKTNILKGYYFSYRDKVEQLIQDFVFAGRQVLHVAVHTFTPELNGEVRDAAVGLLYDPQRKFEQTLCRQWKQALAKEDEDLLVRFNYPYLGIADGFPTYLRRKFSADEYVGIELEVNQKYVLGDKERWQQLKHNLKKTLGEITSPYRADGEQEALA